MAGRSFTVAYCSWVWVLGAHCSICSLGAVGGDHPHVTPPPCQSAGTQPARVVDVVAAAGQDRGYLGEAIVLPSFRCQMCGEPYGATWRVDDAMWRRVAGSWDYLCPLCFDEAARRQGIELHWACKAEAYPLDSEILALETRVIEAGEVLDRLRVVNEHLGAKLGEGGG